MKWFIISCEMVDNVNPIKSGLVWEASLAFQAFDLFKKKKKKWNSAIKQS